MSLEIVVLISFKMALIAIVAPDTLMECSYMSVPVTDMVKQFLTFCTL